MAIKKKKGEKLNTKSSQDNETDTKISVPFTKSINMTEIQRINETLNKRDL